MFLLIKTIDSIAHMKHVKTKFSPHFFYEEDRSADKFFLNEPCRKGYEKVCKKGEDKIS